MPPRDVFEAAGPWTIGWDLGGAHLKACLRRDGQVLDVLERACPLWQGLDRLEVVLDALGAPGGADRPARDPWPAALSDAATRHAVTMTGEMVDHFADRADGVARIADAMARRFGPDGLAFYAGAPRSGTDARTDAGAAGPAGAAGATGAGVTDVGDAHEPGRPARAARWLGLDDLAAGWREVASANWLASASHAALAVGDGLWVDIGSTTTDLVALRGGRVASASRSDADRLASGELVYQGVVRTPLAALAARIGFEGRAFNVMHEWFATSADVYRLSGELDPAHDLQPSADGGPKDPAASARRIARMIGHDAAEAPPEAWRRFALAWRERQLGAIEENLRRVLDTVALPRTAPLVAAGCGAFLVPALARRVGREWLGYGAQIGVPGGGALAATAAGTRDPRGGDEARHRRLAAAADVCAPSVAVAALLDLAGPGVAPGDGRVQATGQAPGRRAAPRPAITEGNGRCGS